MDKLFWIEENRLAGRCGPLASPLSLVELEAAGFTDIVSLDAREYAALRGRGSTINIKLFHLPDSIPPEPLEKRIYGVRLPEAVDYLIDTMSSGRGAVLVHCHAGNDRTGGVLTGYLSRIRSLSPADALAEIRRYNQNAISAPGYEEMILDVLNRVP